VPSHDDQRERKNEKNRPTTHRREQKERSRHEKEQRLDIIPGTLQSVNPAAFASLKNILTVSSEYSARSFPTSESFFRTSFVTVMM